MDGYQALCLALDLVNQGVELSVAADEALDTMHAVNSGDARLIVELAA